MVDKSFIGELKRLLQSQKVEEVCITTNGINIYGDTIAVSEKGSIDLWHKGWMVMNVSSRSMEKLKCKIDNFSNHGVLDISIENI